ncbi:MAG: hypothetical protein IIC25_03645 [Chloroflexi bacterium]|nr:hypothetical protein [Chloroflexota bacterium]
MTTEVEESDLGNPDEEFTTTSDYDGLDRLIQSVDNDDEYFALGNEMVSDLLKPLSQVFWCRIIRAQIPQRVRIPRLQLIHQRFSNTIVFKSSVRTVADAQEIMVSDHRYIGSLKFANKVAQISTFAQCWRCRQN